MNWLWQVLQADYQLLLQGGAVLWCVLLVMTGLWLLLVERWLFARVSSAGLVSQWRRQWLTRDERQSWSSEQIRRQRLAGLQALLMRRLELITALIALCPMLGLLGTVTGMIQVFDVIALHGSNDVSLLAAGIAQATLPTLAGLVAALSGLIGRSLLLRAIQRRQHSLEMALEME